MRTRPHHLSALLKQRLSRIAHLLAVIIVAVLLATPLSAVTTKAAPARATAAATISGTYKVVGRSADDKVYTGTVDIEENGDLYNVSYDVGTTYTGTALLNGNVFSIAVGPEKSCSIGTYKVNDDGTMEGTWNILGTEGTGTETATADSTPDKGSIEGDWTVSGTNQTGGSFDATMTIEKDNSVYKFTRKEGKATLKGTGFKWGNVMSVTFGTPDCQINNFIVYDDNSLSGNFVRNDENLMGDEIATPGLAGKFDVSGKNPDKSTYKTTLTVKDNGAIYDVTWKNSKGTDVGIAIRQAGTVAASLGGASCTLLSFERLPSGYLFGLWGFTDNPAIGFEGATPKSDTTDFVGKYTLSGLTLDGKSYKGDLTIEEDGDLYNFTWTINKKKETGVGVTAGNVIAVSIGDKCGTAVYTIDADNNMDGTWHVSGSASVGTETASPQ